MIKLQQIMSNFIIVSNEGGFEIYFSYNEPIGFSIFGKRYICENVWNSTTGKHINWIDGGTKESKAQRINRNDFLEAYKAFHHRILTPEFTKFV